MIKVPAVLVFFMMLSVLFLVGACGDDDPAEPEDGGVTPGPADPIVQITENITSPRTLFADTVYVVMKYDFYVSTRIKI